MNSASGLLPECVIPTAAVLQAEGGIWRGSDLYRAGAK